MKRSCHPAGLAAVAVALAACGNLLGIEDRYGYGADGGTATAASTTVSTATSTSNGSSTDAASVAGSSTASGDGGGGGYGGVGGDGGGGEGSGAGGDGGFTTASTAGTGGSGGAPCSPDLNNDARHCGACDHDCLEGDCMGGECQPYPLNDPLGSAEYVALRVTPGLDGDVYFVRWRPNGTIFRLAKSNQIAPDFVASAPSAGWIPDIQIDADRIYFTDYSDSDSDPARGVYRVPREGGASTQLVGDDATKRYWGTYDVRVDGEDVFFTSWFGHVGLGKTSDEGSAVEPLLESIGDPLQHSVYGNIELDDDWVYLSNALVGLSRYARDASGVTEYLYGGPEGAGNAGAAPQEVYAVEDGLLYWSDSAGGLRRAPVDGTGPVEVIASGLGRQIVLHGGYIYIIVEDQRAIVRVPVDDIGAEPEQMVGADETTDDIASIALDEISLYWLGFTRGTVFRKAL